MHIDTELTSYGVHIIPKYAFGTYSLSLQELSRYFYDELDYQDCLEVVGAFENAARLLREKNMHGNIPEIVVNINPYMAWIDSSITARSLPYLVNTVEYAEAVRDAVWQIAEAIAKKIGATLPQVSWLLTEVA